MTDDRTKRGEPDRSLVNLQEDYELDYWTKKFGVSREALSDAVKAVGSSADRIEAFLKRKSTR